MSVDEQAALSPGTDHAAARRRAAMLTTGSALLVRVVTTSANLVTVPLLVGYFGQERYGIFAAINAVGVLFNLLDFGTGFALTTAVARVVGAEEDARLRRLISSASLWALGLCLAAFAVGAAIWPWVNWSSVFNGGDAFDAPTMAALVAIIVGFFIFQGWANLGNAVVRGLQAGHWANGALAFAGLGALGATALAIKLEASPLVVTMAFLTPTVISPVVLWLVFAIKDPRVRPLGPVSMREIKPLARAGIGYFVLHLVSILPGQLDLTIIARAHGGAEATPYSVAMRFTGAGMALLAAYLLSLWPAYAEAAARNDWDWIERTHRKSRLVLTTLAIVGAVGFVIVGPFLVGKMAGGARGPLSMYVMLGAAMVLRAWSESHMYLLNGLGWVRAQIWPTLIQAAATITLALALAGPFGSGGVAGAGALGYLLVNAWAIPLIARHALKKRRTG